MDDNEVLDRQFFPCTNSQVEDEVVSKLKDKAKRRKGRGFTGGRGEDRDEVRCLTKSRDRERLPNIPLCIRENMSEWRERRWESLDLRGVSRDGFSSSPGSTRRRRRTTSMTSSRSMARSR